MSSKDGREGRGVREGGVTKDAGNVIGGFDGQGKGHRLRNAGGFQTPEKERNVPVEPPDGTSHADTLMFSPEPPELR